MKKKTMKHPEIHNCVLKDSLPVLNLLYGFTLTSENTFLMMSLQDVMSSRVGNY